MTPKTIPAPHQVIATHSTAQRAPGSPTERVRLRSDCRDQTRGVTAPSSRPQEQRRGSNLQAHFGLRFPPHASWCRYEFNKNGRLSAVIFLPTQSPANICGTHPKCRRGTGRRNARESRCCSPRHMLPHRDRHAHLPRATVAANAVSHLCMRLSCQRHG